MKQFSFILTGEGTQIHPRNAGTIIEAIRRYESSIYFYHQEHCVDAKKIFRLLDLDTQTDDCIYVIVRGRDEAEAVVALRRVLEDSFPGKIRLSPGNYITRIS